jgi:cytochrome c oxidase cbb3-type subunit 3/ubiquinol-cytochrome c reductase cytochrome c subunit
MPAFAEDKGGTLTDAQVKVLAEGIKKRWQPAAASTKAMPTYALAHNHDGSEIKADRSRGAEVFASACGHCHGNAGEGGTHGAINQPAFLALMSDQAVRRLVITGRADLGMPPYDSEVGRGAGFKPLSDNDINELVALLAQWRKGH